MSGECACVLTGTFTCTNTLASKGVVGTPDDDSLLCVSSMNRVDVIDSIMALCGRCGPCSDKDALWQLGPFKDSSPLGRLVSFRRGVGVSSRMLRVSGTMVMIVGVDNQQYQTMRIVSLGCWDSEQKRQVKSISWGSEEKIPMSPTATPEIARVALAGLDPNVVCVCTDEGQRGMRVSRQNIRGVRNCEGARIMPWDI